MPDAPFVSSSFFALRLAGGAPTLIWEGEPFTSMIGICDVDSEGRNRVIVHDTDSGRLDPTAATPRPEFAPPAAAELWIFDVKDTQKPIVAPPRRIPFTEEGPLTLQLSGVPKDASVVVTPRDGNRFPDGTTKTTVPASQMASNGVIKLTIASPVEQASVSVAVTVTDTTGRALAEGLFEIEKDLAQGTQFQDNKHRGKKKIFDGTDVMHFTLDSAAGHGALWFFPEGGGTPVALARGEPFVRPLSGQLSPDGTTLWISDQGGMLFAVELPSDREFARLFPCMSSGTCGQIVDQPG